MKEEKVAIVTSGGGMKCAYAAGALVALAKKLDIKEPDFFISASGSVGAMFYYLANQYEEIEKIWLRFMPSPELISLIPPRLNVDYLVDTILRKELPLNVELLQQGKTKWVVPVTDLESGHTKYINSEMWLDPYEVMRAAKAIPLLYGGAVRLGSRPYIDGGVNINMSSLIRKAHAMGATKIICIANTSHPSRGLERFIRWYTAFTKPMIKHLVRKDIAREQWDDMPGDVEILVIGPTYPLPSGLFTRTRRKIVETFQMGHDDLIEKSEEIKKFFGVPAATPL